MHFTGTKSSPLIPLLLKYKKKTRNVQLAWKPSNYCNVSSWRNSLIKLTHNDETKKMAHDSQKVRAKEIQTVSHSVSFPLEKVSRKQPQKHENLDKSFQKKTYPLNYF